MPELALLLLALIAAGAVVLLPMWGRAPELDRDDADAAALRHRVALEALRDVEADRRAGSLDDAGYAEQLAEAEARAVQTRTVLASAVPPTPRMTTGGRRVAVVIAGAIAALLLVGWFVPGAGIANSTVINQGLADVQATEAARQERIGELQQALAEDPEDTDTLSSLADAYLAGSTQDDLVRAAVALQLLIALEPDRVDAYERIMTAYLRGGDHANARAAHDTYVGLDGADPAEAAFFDGLIAMREDDPDAARDAFDRFLELAPDDPRASMVRGLRDPAGS
jgi:cytochrome c-type biogenesis protein CcmH/NrfG